MNRVLPVALSAVLAFAAVAGGAHDLWAAAAVHLAVLALAVAGAFRAAWADEAVGFRASLAVPLGLYVAAVGLSFRGAVNPGESQIAFFDAGAAALAFLLAQNAFAEDGALDVLGRTAAFICVAFLASNAVQALELAGSTMLVNANIQAGFVLLWIPLFADRLRASRGDARGAAFWSAAVTAALVNLLLLKSVTAFFCLVIGLALLNGPAEIARAARRRPGRTALIAIGLLGAAAAAAAAKILLSAPHQDGALTFGAPLGRLEWWKAGLRMFLDHPWTGIGAGNYPSAYLAYRTGVVENTLYAHNALVAAFAETGILGAAAAAALLGAWASRASRGGRWPLCLGLLLFFLHALANISLEILSNRLAAAFVMGAAVAPALRERARPRRAVLIVLAALAVAAVPYVVSPFLASRHQVTGDMDLADGRLDEARRQYRAARALNPLAWEAPRGLARVEANVDLSSAIENQKEAIRLNDRAAFLWWELAQYLEKAGRREEALQAADAAAARHRGNAVLEKNVDRLRRSL